MEHQPDQQIDMDQQIPQVDVKTFAAKYRSKREIYNFLCNEVGAFLCHHDNLSIYFLK